MWPNKKTHKILFVTFLLLGDLSEVLNYEVIQVTSHIFFIEISIFLSKNPKQRQSFSICLFSHSNNIQIHIVKVCVNFREAYRIKLQ